MIAVWMAYAVVVSAVFALAGVALERSLRFARRPGRLAVAIVGSVVVPLLRWLQPSAAGHRGIVTRLSAPLDLGTQALVSLSNVNGMGAFDTPLIVLWIAASLTLLISILVVQTRVVRDARRCTKGVVDGVAVLRTRSFGPAVVGSLKSYILLPTWTDGLEARFRRLAVLHECEHLRARDPQLLFCAFLLAALQPWNVALWWQLTRLRKAIELDCDQRILNAGVDVRSYGNLLLHIASRRGPTPLTTLTISNTRTFVERRITAMADQKVRGKHLRAALAAVCGVVLFGLGCETPSPVEVEERDANLQQQQEILATNFAYRHYQRLIFDRSVPLTVKGIQLRFDKGVPVTVTGIQLRLGTNIAQRDQQELQQRFTEGKLTQAEYEPEHERLERIE